MRRALLSFAVALVLLVAFVTFIGPAALATTLAGTNLLIFAVGLLAMAGALVCWSEGLRPLLDNAGVAIPRRRLVLAYTASMFGRQVLPLGAVGGPAITAYTVDRESGLGYNETLAVVVVAEFLATVGSLALAAIGVALLFEDLAAVPQLRLLVYATGVFTVAFLLLGGAFLHYRGSVGRVLEAAAWAIRATVGRASKRISTALEPARTATALDHFYGTVDRVGADRRTVAVSIGLHFVGWILAAIPLYTGALALDVSLPLGLVFLLVPASHLVAILPLPGGLGGIEIVLATILAATMGLALPVATAIALLYRLCAYWFVVGIGAVASVYSAAGLVGVREPIPEQR